MTITNELMDRTRRHAELAVHYLKQLYRPSDLATEDITGYLFDALEDVSEPERDMLQNALADASARMAEERAKELEQELFDKELDK